MTKGKGKQRTRQQTNLKGNSQRLLAYFSADQGCVCDFAGQG